MEGANLKKLANIAHRLLYYLSIGLLLYTVEVIFQGPQVSEHVQSEKTAAFAPGHFFKDVHVMNSLRRDSASP